jgi:hypothetical protein
MSEQLYGSENELLSCELFWRTIIYQNIPETEEIRAKALEACGRAAEIEKKHERNLLLYLITKSKTG